MKPYLKYGLVAGLALGVTLFVSVMMIPEDFDYSQPRMGGGAIWWFIRTAIIFATMYLGAKEFRDDSGGFISVGGAFGQAYKVGFFTLVTYTFASILCYYFFIPDWFPIDFDQWMAIMEESSNGDISQMEPMFRWIYDYMTELVIFGGLAINLIAYLIPALTVGLVLSKEDKSEINL